MKTNICRYTVNIIIGGDQVLKKNQTKVKVENVYIDNFNDFKHPIVAKHAKLTDRE